MADGQRPTVATVFGILNIVFGGLGVFGIFGALAWFSLGAPILGVLSLGSTAGSALLLFSGILLITNKGNALQITNLSIIVSLALTAASILFGVIKRLPNYWYRNDNNYCKPRISSAYLLPVA